MRKIRASDIAIAGVIIVIIMLILVPLPTVAMDIAITLNIIISLSILMLAIYSKEPLEFSVFPALLLITTLYRIALNINSTRLILGNNGDAGEIIRTFGEFVAGGELVIGIVIFFIIIIVQFIVITKGAERVAEVAARFTLDAMPGKQMAIDADLNSGAIDENMARERRRKIERESDFYGSMDGASKFVKGDAIVSIIITIVNIVGGIIIGVSKGGVIGDVLNIYVIATIGDGLVSQIPALLISTATGIIVTKATSEVSLGSDLSAQFLAQPVILIITGAVLFLINFIPGMPHFIMVFLALTLATLGFMLMRAARKPEEITPDEHVEQLAEETRKPENVVSLLQVDPIELEFGYGVIPLADVSQGGDLLDRIVMIRRQCAIDLGMIVPVIRLRDNIQFAPNEYRIKIKGNEVALGEIMLDHYLAMNPGDVIEELEGIETVEPAFGLPAIWISDKQRERAELLGYTIVDPPSVIATHLTEIIRRNADELLGRQQVQVLLDNLKQSQPSLVDEVHPKQFSLGEIQKILGNLLREGVSIRDMGTIVETLGDYANITRDPDLLTEYVRQALRRTITKRFVPDNNARVITLDPELEKRIMENVRQTEHGSYVSMDPNSIQKLFANLKDIIEKVAMLGISPIVLTSPVVRFHFKKMVEQLAPDLVVLSYNELEQNVNIQSDGMVNV